jgi:Tfp pilus assembly protein FimT
MKGYTINELLVTMMLVSISSMIALSNLKQLEDPVNSSTAELISFFKLVRAKAISTTSAYTVTAQSNSKIITTVANVCSSNDQVTDNKVVLNLPLGASLTDTAWVVCFNSRGLPDANIQIGISGESGLRTIEVYLGGGVQEVDV